MAEALEQSAREAEMTRAMAGGLNGKEEDDEEDEVVGTLKKKSGQGTLSFPPSWTESFLGGLAN